MTFKIDRRQFTRLTGLSALTPQFRHFCTRPVRAGRSLASRSVPASGTQGQPCAGHPAARWWE